MSYPYAAYEFIVYVIPGGLILFTLMALFPAVRELFGVERIDAGGLGIFLILAFILGQFIHALSHRIVEAPMIWAGLAHQTDGVLLNKNPKLLNDGDRSKLADRVKRELDVSIDSLDLGKPADATVWRGIVRRLHSTVNQKTASDRLEIYARQYAMNRNISTGLIAVLLILGALLFVQLRRNEWLEGFRAVDLRGRLGVGLLLVTLAAIVISLQSIAHFDHLFARELFSAYVHMPPNA
jgi:hypothetical protein